MSEEKAKAREWTLVFTTNLQGEEMNPHVLDGPIISGYEAEVKVVEISALQEAQKEIAELKAKLWVAKDNALRTYDGLAEKADKYDEAKEMLEKMASALEKIQRKSAHMKSEYAGKINQQSTEARKQYLEWKKR